MDVCKLDAVAGTPPNMVCSWVRSILLSFREFLEVNVVELSRECTGNADGMLKSSLKNYKLEKTWRVVHFKKY